jgi:hypothetical protein
VLGAIDPGTDTQLAAGMVMSMLAIVVFCLCLPYCTQRDNLLAVLTNIEIFLVMLTAMVMKRDKEKASASASASEEEDEGEDFDDKYLGTVLIVLNALNLLIFAGWGYVRFGMEEERKSVKATSAFKVRTGSSKSDSGGEGLGAKDELRASRSSASEESKRQNRFLRALSSGAEMLGFEVGESRAERRRQKDEETAAYEAKIRKANKFAFHDGAVPGPPPGRSPSHLRTKAEREERAVEMKTFESFASYNEDDEENAFSFRNPAGNARGGAATGRSAGTR